MKKNIKKFLSIVLISTLSLMLYAQDVHIHNNTTWNTNQTINGSLYIWNNAELRIHPGVTVDMAGNPLNRIIIRPDAALIAGGAVFQSSTGLWAGIVLEGLGSMYPQNGTPAQPRLVLNSCTVTDAMVGVSTGYFQANLSGGWITLNKCTISNFDHYGVVLRNYIFQDQSGNYISDLSRINETVFTSSKPSARAGIGLELTHNVRVLGCKFIGQPQNASDYTGIQIHKSSAIIKSKLNHSPPPATVVRNEFLDCPKGIWINNGYDPAYKVLIDNNFFEYNSTPFSERVAIQAIAAKQLDIFSNEIKLRTNCPSSPCTAPRQFGIHLNHCTGFHVENNHISMQTSNGTYENTYGIVVANSGGQANEIYGNIIIDCYYSIQAVDMNRGDYSSLEPYDDGLRFFCNTTDFTTTYNYYALSATVSDYINQTDPRFGVAKMQGGSMIGTPNSPAFNVINRTTPLPFGSERDFHNQHHSNCTLGLLTDVVYMEPKSLPGIPWYYIQYYTGPDNNPGIPNHVKPLRHPDITADDEVFPRCENRIPSGFPSIEDIITSMQTAHDDFQIGKSGFMNFANDGDHSFMLNLANNIDGSNYIFIYAEMMSNNPSHDVLAIVAASEYMPAAYLRDILVQNSYGIKNHHVREAINNRIDTLSQAQINDIQQASEFLSLYETHQMNVSYYSNQLRKQKNLLYDFYLVADTNLVDLNGIIDHLDADDDFQSKFSLLMYYYYQMDQANVDIYKQVLYQSTLDNFELNALDPLFEILDIIYFNYGGDYTQLNQSEIEMLEVMVPGTTVASGIALSLLEGHLGYSFPLPSTDLSTATPRIGRIPVESTPTGHIVYPNPATSMVTVSLTEKVDGAQVIILDMAGRTVMTAPLTDEATTLDVSRLGNGIYIIRIIGTNKPIGTEKLIINK